jgi:hypothetical protein
VEKRKKFSERLHGLIEELVMRNGMARTAADLGLQGNYFSPSKYGMDKFSVKGVGHIDALEEYFGMDFLGGVTSALALEVESAEGEGMLTAHDRNAIHSVIEAARQRGKPDRGAAAIREVEKRRKPKSAK